MPKDTTNTPTAKAITDSQLLKHLLDSPYRTGPNSALFKEDCRPSLRDALFCYFDGWCLDDDLAHRLLDALCESEDPTQDLSDSINNLEDWLESLRQLKMEFYFLKEYCWPHDEDADQAAAGHESLSVLPAIGSLST